VVTTKSNQASNKNLLEHGASRRSFGSLTADKKVSFNNNTLTKSHIIIPNDGEQNQINFESKNSRN